jgi:hypothetical protein
MSADLLERPVLPGAGEDDDAMHLFCCDENIAMCGEDLTEDETVDADDVDDDEVCPLCQLVEDNHLACPVPGCPAADGAEVVGG